MAKIVKKVKKVAKTKTIVKDTKPIVPKLTKAQAYYGQMLASVEKAEGITGALDETNRLSSGSLVVDVTLGGGLTSGWYGFSGKEQSGKSTLMAHIFGQGLRANIPVMCDFDAEGSVDGTYTGNILGVKSLSSVLASTNKELGHKPIRYYDTSSMEQIFRTMKRILLRMPDKRYRADNNQWYFVFDRTQNQTRMKDAMGLSHDKRLYSDTGHYWCATDDNSLQGIFCLDSLPTIIPDTVAEAEDTDSSGIGLQAREYAQWIPQVKGKLRRKHVLLLAVNQIRERPMVRFGNPEYEPCGNAVKHANDVRSELGPRAVPQGWPQGLTSKGNKTTQFGTEDSVHNSDAVDEYAYKAIKNSKNKRGRPYLSGSVRVWIRDHNNQGRGIDPVYDGYQYLEMTGQLTSEKVKKEDMLTLKIGDYKQRISWDNFKRAILAELGDKQMQDAIANKLKWGPKQCVIRKLCQQQIASGKVWSLLTDED